MGWGIKQDYYRNMINRARVPHHFGICVIQKRPYCSSQKRTTTGPYEVCLTPIESLRKYPMEISPRFLVSFERHPLRRHISTYMSSTKTYFDRHVVYEDRRLMSFERHFVPSLKAYFEGERSRMPTTERVRLVVANHPYPDHQSYSEHQSYLKNHP